MEVLGRRDILNIDRALGLYRVLDEDGNPVAGEPSLPDKLLLDMYTYMVRARILDGWLLKLQRMGRVALHAPNKGQEAAAVGATLALKREDWLFPSYRELGALLVRGMTEEEILDRALTTIDDPLKGSDFAIYGHRKYNIVPAPVPVANQIPHAVGAALAAKIMGDKIVTMTFFGDGSTSRGDFHTGLNFAGVFKAPVVFVNQNNQWAISVPLKRQTASPTIAIKGVAYGVPGIRVDGNDVIAVYTVAMEAVERARSGEGPTLIEAVTYRLGPHTTADDPTRYRVEEEVREWERKEPLRRMRRYLISRGLLTEEEDKALWSEWEKRIEETVVKVLEKPPLPPEVVLEDVYEEPPWNLREQMRELRDSIRLLKELGVELE
ncbi:MAG: pyruvate dehydrogenase (acetyl-transferring) E1 component subunit alpha [Desulfurococcales archaeon]|nr:pyruvate dehydrogenase (acetyl-transferring) E1 component subunit alpha [Desulfurococcales archaeon]